MSEMKLIMENWKTYLTESVEEPIETYGQLRSQLDTAIRTKKKSALKSFGIGLVFDVLGGGAFVSAAQLIKTMYSLPDEKKTGTVLDTFLNVDDDVSAIVDDNLENAFLQDFVEFVQKQPDEKKITDNVTIELQKYIAKKYNQNTVKT